MKTHSNYLLSKQSTCIGLLSVLAYAMVILWSPASFAAYHEGAKSSPESQHHDHAVGLVKVARDATERYQSVETAVEDGYVLATACVSSESEGSMGVHYARLDLFGDGVSDPAQPELLVYEPTKQGSLRLVAVEYIIFADLWDAANPGVPPQWIGQAANYEGAPNRFALPAVYELHVWAWKHNPAGMFANFNPKVTCEYYSP